MVFIRKQLKYKITYLSHKNSYLLCKKIKNRYLHMYALTIFLLDFKKIVLYYQKQLIVIRNDNLLSSQSMCHFCDFFGLVFV